MASLYEFDSTRTLAAAAYPKSAVAVVKVEKALAKKKIPKPHIDKFVMALKKVNLNAIVLNAQTYIGKHMIAKGLAPVTARPSALQKLMLVALFGPQKKILKAKFDLSVHSSGKNLVLQHTDCKGGKKTMFTVSP